MILRPVVVAFGGLLSLIAPSLAQDSGALTPLIEKHWKDISNGKAPKASFTAAVVMAPDSEDLVAVQSPVPKTGETYANAQIVLRCVDQRGLPLLSRKPGEKDAKYFTLSGSLADTQIAMDTGAYETNALAQFSLTVENCDIKDRPVTPESAAAERNIALMNTKALYPGPTFTCPDLAKCNPLAQVILSEAQSARQLGLADIALVQPYQVLRHAKPDSQKALREESVRFAQATEKACKLPKKFQADEAHGNLVGTDRFAGCIKDAYDKQRAVWLEQVRATGIADANEEASRPARDHYLLQLLLVYHGFLPQDSKVDGSYGAGTRNAIAAVQKEAKMPENGYMSDATADYLKIREDRKN